MKGPDRKQGKETLDSLRYTVLLWLGCGTLPPGMLLQLNGLVVLALG